MRNDIKKKLYKFIKNNTKFFVNYTIERFLIDKTTYSQSHTSNKKMTTRINFSSEVLNRDKVVAALNDNGIIESDNVFIGWSDYGSFPYLCISITK